MTNAASNFKRAEAIVDVLLTQARVTKNNCDHWGAIVIYTDDTMFDLAEEILKELDKLDV